MLRGELQEARGQAQDQAVSLTIQLQVAQEQAQAVDPLRGKIAALSIRLEEYMGQRDRVCDMLEEEREAKAEMEEEKEALAVALQKEQTRNMEMTTRMENPREEANRLQGEVDRLQREANQSKAEATKAKDELARRRGARLSDMNDAGLRQWNRLRESHDFVWQHLRPRELRGDGISNEGVFREISRLLALPDSGDRLKEFAMEDVQGWFCIDVVAREGFKGNVGCWVTEDPSELVKCERHPQGCFQVSLERNNGPFKVIWRWV